MSFLPINVDFSKHTNLPNKDYGVIDVHFGSDSPLLEVELNEAQILTRNLTKNLISNYFKDGLLEISSYSYGGGVLSLTNATIFFQGNIIRVTNTNISAANGSKIYLNVKESMKTFNDVLYPEGNLSKATDNNNYFIDSRIGSVTSNRTVLEFKISTQQESGFSHLLIGSISSNVFNVDNLIPNVYQLLHKGTYGGSASDLKKDIDSKEPIINKKTGFNLDKTDLTENDSNKVFTPKGALNLFNTLTTNFTSDINTAKEALRADIVKKLNKPVVLNEDMDTEEKLRSLRVGTYILNEKIIWQYNEGRRGYYTIIVKTDNSTTNDNILEVQHSGAGGGHIHQGAWNSGRWTGWVLIFTKNDPPSCDDVGAEPKFTKKSGFNLDKVDVEENDTNKLFTAKGALTLKNWLVTNYTTLMNNIRDTLTNSINTKLPHGGYGGSGQQLKNEIDDINNTRFRIMAKSIGNTSTNTDLNTIVDNGFYVSVSSSNLFTNKPTGISGAFELTVTGLTDGILGYKTQLIKNISYNKYYVRTNAHWSDSNWTPWQQLAFDDEVYKRCKYLPNGLPTAESILNLEPGIYNVAMSPIFELPTGYYTVQRLNTQGESGDNTVIVYKAGSGEKFYITSFNSNKWTGWKEFNHCPYNVGDFYFTSNTKNPALVWHGTSWELIEGRMLIGAKYGQFNLGTTGGNQNINLALGQLPRFRLQVDSFNLGRGTMNITGTLGAPTKEGAVEGTGAFVVSSTGSTGRSAGSGGGHVAWNFDASRAWTGTTTSASPYTNYVGNGESINIMNPYLAINIWKRIG